MTANAHIVHMLQCCDCGAALSGPDACGTCGRVFDDEDGTPRFFPEHRREAVFDVDLARISPAAIDRDGIYRFPPRSGQNSKSVYHLDDAHIAVFEAIPKGGVVLECGCGGGQMRSWVTEQGLLYVGTDISKTRVFEWLQDYGGADVLCDVHALPFQDNSFDVVYAAAVWEHLAFPQVATQEVARVLKPGGYFIGSASFLEPWHDESYYHFTPNGLFSFLDLARLETEAIWPEKRWSGFRALLAMGNAVTRPFAWVGSVFFAVVLFPKRLKIFLKSKTWPTDAAMYADYAKMAGAIAWIARKPIQERAA